MPIALPKEQTTVGNVRTTRSVHKWFKGQSDTSALTDPFHRQLPDEAAASVQLCVERLLFGMMAAGYGALANVAPPLYPLYLSCLTVPSRHDSTLTLLHGSSSDLLVKGGGGRRLSILICFSFIILL